MTSVAVCVATYLRPASLERALAGIGRLAVDDGVDVTVVVVDNDPAASGRDVVARSAGGLPWPVAYAVEPRPGISAARNRAVELAGAVDFVTFVDDDQVPGRGWLSELLRVQRDSGAPIVTGPTLPRFEETPPAWAVRGRFFEPPRYATGTPIHWAATGNVLVAAGLLEGDIPPFDESFGLSGGEDTHLFMRLWLAGHRIVWADEAEMVEWVPPSRTRVRWVLAREFRRGNTLSLCLRDLQDSAARRVRRAGAAALRMVHGAVIAVAGFPLGRHIVLRGLHRACLGAGQLTGLARYRYRPYRPGAG